MQNDSTSLTSLARASIELAERAEDPIVASKLLDIAYDIFALAHPELGPTDDVREFNCKEVYRGLH
jgi:hypothetical protein